MGELLGDACSWGSYCRGHQPVSHHPPGPTNPCPTPPPALPAAIKALKERNGSSLPAIKKYIGANYKLPTGWVSVLQGLGQKRCSGSWHSAAGQQCSL